MPSFHARILPRSRWSRPFFTYIYDNLNFFRTHLLIYTFTPFIFSGIFYASNGHNRISYIDALFNCVSAMTVCGLATVDLSSLTDWQQGILFLQMCIGSPVVVSWVMVLIRRHFLARELKRRMEMHKAEQLANGLDLSEATIHTPWWKRILRPPFTQSRTDSGDSSNHGSSTKGKKPGHWRRLRTDMIRRVDDAPQLVTPSGWISEGRMSTVEDSSSMDNKFRASHRQHPNSFPARHLAFSKTPTVESPEPFQASTLPNDNSIHNGGSQAQARRASRRLSDPGATYDSTALPLHRSQTIHPASQLRGRPMTRTQTVEFAPTPLPVHERVHSMDRERRARGPSMSRGQSTIDSVISEESRPDLAGPSQMVRPSIASTHSRHTTLPTKQRGYGGFPMPHEIISALVHRFFPNVENRLKRTLTIPATQTISSQHGVAAPGSRVVPYISFEATVGRNSSFYMLTREQMEELGGVEFKALNALLWIVPTYHIAVQLISFIVIAPYISTSRWASRFDFPYLQRHIAPAWFALFQVVSAYTNTGMSLSDKSMIPFQRAYPMILFMAFLIVAGNTGFPVFLRFMIWTISKSIRKTSKLYEPLTFLLDHPRRCFIYLFPSHQTWFLLTVVVSLTFTDWFFFLVLDIGNEDLSSIPIGVRFIIGLLQATAVRAAGFVTVSLSALAPAVRVLYVVMMYVSVYPIAMSVRSTNVYEEKSLGVFDDDDESVDEAFQPIGTTATVWSRYLASHMRKQLSFDMWWLALALFLVCIIERGGLSNDANATWFNIFSILFEIVSAYGTVGLSLGVPFANYSLAGAFKPLSKLIICVVMIRGRHRGLPVAIDRAVMLPDFKSEDQRSLRRRPSQGNASIGNWPTSGGDRFPMHPTSTIPNPIRVPGNEMDKSSPFQDHDCSPSFEQRQRPDEDAAAV